MRVMIHSTLHVIALPLNNEKTQRKDASAHEPIPRSPYAYRDLFIGSQEERLEQQCHFTINVRIAFLLLVTVIVFSRYVPWLTHFWSSRNNINMFR